MERKNAQFRLCILDSEQVYEYLQDENSRFNISPDSRRMPMWLEVSSDGGETWALVWTKGGMKFSQSKFDHPVVEVCLPIFGILGSSDEIPQPGIITHADPENYFSKDLKSPKGTN